MARPLPWWLRGPAISVAAVVLFAALSELALATLDLVPKRSSPIVIWNPEFDADIKNPRGTFRFHPGWMWEPRPGAIVQGDAINDEAYRGPEYPVARTGKFRVATLGDSSTFGFNLPEKAGWPRRLEGMLRESGVDAEVLNFGVVGFTSIQGLELYRGKVRDYRPDVVVAAFGCCNDQFPQESGLTDIAKLQVIRPWSFRARMFLERYQTFRFLDKVVDRIANGNAKKPAPKPPDPAEAGVACDRVRVPIADFEMALTEIDRMQREDGHHLVVVCPPRMTNVESEWPCTKRYTEAIHLIAPKLGAPLAEVYDPFRESEMADRKALREVLEKRHADGQGDAPPKDDLALSLKRMHLFLDSFHPNADGHVVYAQLVLRAMRAGGLLTGVPMAPNPAPTERRPLR